MPHRVALVLLVLLAVGCVSGPATQSGRPERIAPVPRDAARDALLAEFAASGWALETESPSSLVIRKPTEGGAEMWFGVGSWWVVTFTLAPRGDSTGVYARVEVIQRPGGVERRHDVSEGNAAREIQERLERLWPQPGAVAAAPR